MSLDDRLWQRLQDHGVSEEHLDLLLAVLDMQRNGSFCLNYVNGHIEQADVRVTVPNRSRELARVRATVPQVIPRAKTWG